MEEIYNYILDNIYIFCLILVLVFVLIIFIMYLVKNGNGDYSEPESKDKTLKSKAELEKISDEEIEKRVIEEYKEETKELDEKLDKLKENYKDNTTVEAIIDNLKDAKEKRTSDDLRKFEEEQEEQAIISYQQLLEAVKGNDKKEEVKTPIEEKEEAETEKLLEKIDNLEMEIDDEPVMSNDEKIDYSYKPNEFISPVFGRMDSSKVRYREGLSYTDKKEKEPVIDELHVKPTPKVETNEESLYKTTRLDSEEFLKNLKEFRRNL